MKSASPSIGGRKLLAFSSEHAVTIAIRWPQQQTADLLGFAIRRTNPDGTIVWLEGLLSFKGQNHSAGEPITSNEGPFQKMYWADYRVRRGLQYEYQVIPVYGVPGNLDLREKKSVKVRIATEDNTTQTHRVHFNRAVIASQAYARNFGLVKPESNPRILQWLARGLDEAILEFIGRAVNDVTLKLDIAGYHMTDAAVIDLIARLGNRARVSLCWKKQDDIDANECAAALLGSAGVAVHLRQNVQAISHNKYMILKNSAGNPLALLMGSTNFTTGGIAKQNNVSHVIEDPTVAGEYLAAFEAQLTDDNAVIKGRNQSWSQVGPNGDIEVNFSPHKAGQRIDLDRYVQLVNNAKSSVFFAMFRGTDTDLLTALVSPKDPDVVVRGLVDRVYEEGSEGEVVLYHQARERDPKVAPATTLSGETDPLTRELAREGFNPLVHHKFIVIDFNRADCVVITGSANYSKNSTEKNDENTLIVQRDQRIAQMYLGEFFRLYEHYRARWFINRQGQSKPEALYLKENGSWARKYYGNTQSAKFLRSLLG